MGINHRGFDILVPKQLWHDAAIVAIFEQVGGKAVTESMATNPFLNTSLSDSLLKGALYIAFMEVVASNDPTPRILRPR
jgi:hypothetical protein